jgi:hypothetical protein
VRESKLTSTAGKLSVGLLVVLLPVSWLVWGSRVGLGVLVGGVLTIANFWFLGWSVQRTLSQSGAPGSAGRFLGLFVLKFIVLAGALGLAVWSGKVHVLGLFLGCSVVVLAVLILAPILGITGLNEEEEHGGHT